MYPTDSIAGSIEFHCFVRLLQDIKDNFNRISSPVKAIVLMGGEDNWSNGIHLNHIEAAELPAEESWLNINVIDDLIYQIITIMDKLTISAVAGGAIPALAADWVLARDGVIFNPHYKNRGNLFGSEYWTYFFT